MAGLNTTGQANTDDYNLGRGTVYFALLDSVTKLPISYRDMGNAPEFSISVETETLEHQSSRAGLKVTDKEVLISQKISLSLTLDEINFQNLAVLLSGTTHDDTGPAPATENGAILGTNDDGMIVSQWIDGTGAGVEVGRWYDMTTLADQGGKRCYDVDSGTPVFAINAGATLVLNTDYTLDIEIGRVFFLTGAGTTDGDGIDFTLAGKGAARRIDEVRSLTQTSVTGALKFVSENPADADKRTEYQFHQVSLKAEGDFALIGDEFTQMQFTAIAETQAIASPNSPTLTIRTLNATIA